MNAICCHPETRQARSSSLLKVRRTGAPDPVITKTSAVVDTTGLSFTSWAVCTILCPSGDQFGSSSMSVSLLVMLIGACCPVAASSTFTMKTSLSVGGAPGSILIGSPCPEAEAWNVMCLPSGAQDAELPRVR